MTSMPSVPRGQPYDAAADVFMFPTPRDPHGHVIEDAHAAGLPVVTSEASSDVRRRERGRPLAS